MKNVLPLLALVFILGSCKVSEVISVDTLANAEMLKEYQTFKLIEEDYFDKRNESLKLTFRDKLLENGFEESSENPDFLVQGVIVTRDFIVEGGLNYYSSIPAPFFGITASGNSYPIGGGGGKSIVNRGMVGKVIFLIQDTKTNEIAWMGISSGVIYGGGGKFDPEDLDIALYEMLASINL